MSNKQKAEIIMGELIGRKTRVTESTDPNKEGTEGKIVDETLNTLKIETEEGEEKKIPKETSKFTFKTDNKETQVNGEEIHYRPEDRIKKNWRKYNGLYR